MDDQNQPQPANKPLVPPDPPSAPTPQAEAAPQPISQPEPVDTQPTPMPPPQSPPPTPEPVQSQQNTTVTPATAPAPQEQFQSPPKKKKALKILLIIVGVIVALFVLLAIIGTFLKPDLTLTEYKNTEFNYTIQRPVKWEEETKTSVGAKTTLFTDKVKGEKNLYRAYMEVSATTEKYPSLVSNSDELFDQMQSSIKTELSGFAPTNTDNTDFKGNKARRLEGTYKSGSEVGKAIVLIIIEPDGQAEALLLASPEKSFDTYEKTFNEIIESFNP